MLDSAVKELVNKLTSSFETIADKEIRKSGAEDPKLLVKSLVDAFKGEFHAFLSDFMKAQVSSGKPINTAQIINAVENRLTNISSKAFSKADTSVRGATGGKVGLNPSILTNINNSISDYFGTNSGLGKTLKNAEKKLDDVSNEISKIGVEGTKVVEAFSKLTLTAHRIDDLLSGNITVESLKELSKEFKELHTTIKDSKDSFLNIGESGKRLQSFINDIINKAKDTFKKTPNINAQPVLKEIATVKRVVSPKEVTKTNKSTSPRGPDEIQKFVYLANSIRDSLSTIPATVIENKRIKGEKFDEPALDNFLGDIKNLTSALNKLRDAALTKNIDDLIKTIFSVYDAASKVQAIYNKPILGKDFEKQVIELSSKYNINLEKSKAVELPIDDKKIKEKVSDAIKEGLNVADTKELKEKVSDAVKEGAEKGISESIKKVNIKDDIKKTDIPKVDRNREANNVAFIRDSINEKIVRGLKVPSFKDSSVIEPGVAGGISLERNNNISATGDSVREAMNTRINELADSLNDLQKYMVKSLEEAFSKSADIRGKRGWEIVRDKSDQNIKEYFSLVQEGNLKTTGKQFAFSIANVNAIKSTLSKRGRAFSESDSSERLLEKLKQSEIDKLAKESKTKELDIASWIKIKSKEEIKETALPENVIEKLTKIKSKIPRRGISDKAIIDIIKSEFSNENIETLFKETIGNYKAEAFLTKKPSSTTGFASPFLRKIAIPAGRLTSTGALSFATARSSERAIPRFATFKTGFEDIFDALANKKVPDIYGKYGDIKNIGVRPQGLSLEKANTVAANLLKDFSSTGETAIDSIKSNIIRASKLKGIDLQENTINTLVNDLKTNLDTFSKNAKEAGIFAYDIVKSMDKIEFESIYDVIKKVVAQPLEALGKEPYSEKAMRDYEEAIQQVVQNLPLIELGKPRRAFQQENVLG